MSVQFITIDQSSSGQRVDNFLFKKLKGVPKSRIYRALRKGEVRVNKKRVKPTSRLNIDDIVRLPPLSVASKQEITPPGDKLTQTILNSIIFEDDNCLVINKPSGMPVHAGSGFNAGLIELLRLIKADFSDLELVHRLDKATSGCLLIAKNRDFLTHCHDLLVSRAMCKQYLALVKGVWQGGVREVSLPLSKRSTAGADNVMVVDSDGKPSVTIFTPVQVFAKSSLVMAYPKTGRMHQIRVHSAAIGHNIARDDKYGDDEFNIYIKEMGLNRLFLHASKLSFDSSAGFKGLSVDAELPDILSILIDKLN